MDECTSIASPLPSHSVLSRFQIIITSNERFTSEYKRVYTDSQKNYPPETSHAPSPLLQVRWRRLVIDEGHSLGKPARNNSILFGTRMNSTFRWCITGTPTPEVSGKSALPNILQILLYLKVECLYPQLGGKEVWKDEFAAGWTAGDPKSYMKMVRLISELLISHSKSEILKNTPVEVRTVVPMSESEIRTYNTIASVVRINILLTKTLEGVTSGWQDCESGRGGGEKEEEKAKDIDDQQTEISSLSRIISSCPLFEH